MRNLSNLTPGELATRLMDLTFTVQSSGPLRPLAFALAPYAGRGDEQLDQQIKAFDAAREDYEYRVVRGYGGVMEWRRVVAVAEPLAKALNDVQE